MWLERLMSENTGRSLRYFEILSLAALALGVIVAGLQYNALASSPDAAALGGSVGVIIVQFIVLLFSAVIILLISRKKSKIAKWVWVVLFVIGLPFYIPQLARMFDAGFAGVISSGQFLMICASIYFLFTPDARQAMKRN